MAVIKIILGERIRECQEADLAYFEARGYKKLGGAETLKKKVAAKRGRPKKAAEEE